MKKIIITCEHGGNEVPKDYQYLFQDNEILQSHEAWDIGALAVAKKLAKNFADFFFFSTITRLLVELNRSPHNIKLFSKLTRKLNKNDKLEILNRYYFSYRDQVESAISQEVKRNYQILHISVHSFTPVFANKVREFDIGLLYDPLRKNEKAFCLQWKKSILDLNPTLVVKRNKPYLGKSDGLVTYLRKKFSNVQYLGIELEMNQKFFFENQNEKFLSNLLINSLRVILN